MKNELYYENKTAWHEDNSVIMAYAEEYKQFLDKSKTEREAVETSIALAEKNGFFDLTKAIKEGRKLSCGDRLYFNNQNKSLVLFVIGSEDIEKGLNITAAHIDSPRLDLKANPLYEDGNFAFFKTHYYGGIKKYQWTATPLALHGVIETKSGEVVRVNIGEDEKDPVFYISDLLVHLSAEQMAKVASSVITGEQLNIIIGNIPIKDEDKESVKLNILNILNKTYNINEEDFLYAEIEAVPAMKCRDVGFDRSMIASYGHDDKVCSFPAVSALFDIHKPARTCAAILADKEEIGSYGSTGLVSYFFDNAVAEVIALLKDDYNELSLRRALSNSLILSMDVGCGFDPNFSEAYDKQNAAMVGNGVILTKYTGARGKSGSNDAHSEYLNKLRKVFADNNVDYQTGELGKVDQGGGGTVASELSRYGCHTVDFGVAVISMHAPIELISKADLYSAFAGAKCFYCIKE